MQYNVESFCWIIMKNPAEELLHPFMSNKHSISCYEIHIFYLHVQIKTSVLSRAGGYPTNYVAMFR